MAEEILKGQRFFGAGKAPSVITTERTCVQPDCETKLSRYNRREFCFAHAPTRFPRLRGRVATEI